MKKRLGILSIGALIAFAVFSLNSNGASAHSVRPATVQNEGSGSDSSDCDDDSDEADLSAYNVAYSDDDSDEADDSCPPPPVDVCPNISGNQSEVPAGMIVDNSGNCVTPEVSAASATFTLECFADHPLLVATVTVTGPDPAPDQFLTLVTNSGSLNDVQDINWVTQAYSVLQADAFGAAVGDSLTANLVLGTTTVSSQTFTVPDCAPAEVTTTTAAPTTTTAAPTTTTEAPATTAPATTAPATTQPAPTTVATGQPPVPPTNLPKTGSSSGILVAIAALLLLLGGSLLIIRRRPATN